MEFIYNLLVALHLLGMAALVGGYLAVVRTPRPNPVMVWGARVQLLTGLLIVGIGEGAGLWDDPNHMKIGVKLVVALAVLALVEVAGGRSRKGQDSSTLVHAAGGLAVVNVLIATLWN